MAEGYGDLRAEFGGSRTETARRLGVEADEATRFEELAELPTLVQEAVAQGALQADQAQALAMVDDERVCARLLVRAFNERLTAPEIRLLARDWAEGR